MAPATNGPLSRLILQQIGTAIAVSKNLRRTTVITQYERDGYLWRKTWHGAQDDYIAFDGKNLVGRVDLGNTIAGLRWLWSIPTDKGGTASRAGGSAENVAKAAAELRRMYEGAHKE